MVSRSEKFYFALPARLTYRDAAKSFLQSLTDHLVSEGQLPDEQGHHIISAFVEAFNNACIHAYPGADCGEIQIALDLGSDALTLTVRDRGKRFEPAKVPEPDLDSLPEGGLGLFIIRNFMDEVEYVEEAGWNVLVMVKRFERAKPEEQSPTSVQKV